MKTRSAGHHVLLQVLLWCLTSGSIAITLLDLFLRISAKIRLENWLMQDNLRYFASLGILIIGMSMMILLWTYFIPDLWRRRHWSKTTRLSLGCFLLSLPYGMLVYYYWLYTPRQQQRSSTRIPK